MLAAAHRKADKADNKDRLGAWALALEQRRGYWKAVVAIASKSVLQPNTHRGDDMPVYVIADIEVLDQALFEEYRQKVPATIAAHGGRYLARGGATDVLEGSWSPRRCVILEFPDMGRFRAWWDSPEYAPLRALRQRATHSNLVVTQGIEAGSQASAT